MLFKAAGDLSHMVRANVSNVGLNRCVNMHVCFFVCLSDKNNTDLLSNSYWIIVESLRFRML